MEKLIVRDFLVIKSADFEVGRISLIIGPQASGKSLIAKLLYFFRNFLNSTYLESAKNFELKKDIEKQAITDFEAYFPRYTWANQLFTIRYEINDISIDLSRKKNRSGQVILKFNYSINLVSLHKRLKSTYKKRLEEPKDSRFGSWPDFDPFFQVIEECVFDTPIGSSFNFSLFIPASRSFFANLQRNVFSFLANNIEIDPFKGRSLTFFIEEPEAHLFPVSQRHVVSLFGLLYNRAQRDFVITTHSPYILTAVNNMILAKDVATRYGEDRLKGIMEPHFTIVYEDVRAYTIEDGELVSIRDDNSRLIGENIIDSVSDEFGAEFDALVNLQAGIR